MRHPLMSIFASVFSLLVRFSPCPFAVRRDRGPAPTSGAPHDRHQSPPTSGRSCTGDIKIGIGSPSPQGPGARSAGFVSPAHLGFCWWRRDGLSIFGGQNARTDDPHVIQAARPFSTRPQSALPPKRFRRPPPPPEVPPPFLSFRYRETSEVSCVSGAICQHSIANGASFD